MAKVHLKRQIPLDVFLRQLTDGAYVVLKRQQIEEQSDETIKHEIEKVIRKILSIDLEVAEECGLSLFCQEALHTPPWSQSAQEALRADEEN